MKLIIKGLPGYISKNENESFSVMDQSTILAEMEDAITVGFKAVVEHRTYEHKDGAITCNGVKEQYGDYKKLPKDTTVKDIADAINECVENTQKLMFGEA